MRHTEHGLLLPDPIRLPRGACAMSPQLTALGSAAGQVTALGGGVTVFEAATAWYLATGITADNVAAWQAKGAASLAASYLKQGNLAGNADLDPVTVGHGVAPTFDTALGWIGDGAAWLDTGVEVGSGHTGYSIIVMFNNHGEAQDALAGIGDNDTWLSFLQLNPHQTAGATWFYGDTSLAVVDTGNQLTSGIMALLAGQAYEDDHAVGSAMSWAGTYSATMYVMSSHWKGDIPISKLTGNIAAIAIYNVTLTEAQYLAIRLKMLAL